MCVPGLVGDNSSLVFVAPSLNAFLVIVFVFWAKFPAPATATLLTRSCSRHDVRGLSGVAKLLAIAKIDCSYLLLLDFLANQVSLLL